MQGALSHLQGEVLEEIQHHYPLDLLMALSDAAVGAMQASAVCSEIAMMLSSLILLKAAAYDTDAPVLQCLCMHSERCLSSWQQEQDVRETATRTIG